MMTQTRREFIFEKYLVDLSCSIKTIFSRKTITEPTFDILDTEKTTANKMIALKEKQRLMKTGEIWQYALGNYKDFTNLKTGHVTGLDILSDERKIAIELKNRTNTDNSSSKLSNLNKLAAFKEKNSEYTCIYANINADTEEKTIRGLDCFITHNGVIIRHMVGKPFLEFMLGEDTDKIIEFIKTEIDKYM